MHGRKRPALVGVIAHLFYFLFQGFQIFEGLGPPAGVPEQSGWMEQGHDLPAVDLEPLSMFLGDFEVRLDQHHGGNSAQANDQFGVDQIDLPAQPADTGLLLGVERITVVGGDGI